MTINKFNSFLKSHLHILFILQACMHMHTSKNETLVCAKTLIIKNKYLLGL